MFALVGSICVLDLLSYCNGEEGGEKGWRWELRTDKETTCLISNGRLQLQVSENVATTSREVEGKENWGAIFSYGQNLSMWLCAHIKKDLTLSPGYLYSQAWREEKLLKPYITAVHDAVSWLLLTHDCFTWSLRHTEWRLVVSSCQGDSKALNILGYRKKQQQLDQSKTKVQVKALSVQAQSKDCRLLGCQERIFCIYQEWAL